jgi:hypothetical protein
MRDKLRRPKAAAVLCLLLTAPLAACPGEPDVDLEHGVVYLQLQRGTSQADNPYIGTVKIEVTLLYRECLIAFYDANPDYQQYGTKGALVFGPLSDGGEGWLDRLCDVDNSNLVNCTVDSFRQELSGMTKQLTVLYSIEGDPENRELPFGPVPEPELAACEAGGLPIVRVGSNGAVRGLDGNGNTLWNTESFNPAEATTGQGAAIEIHAARQGG